MVGIIRKRKRIIKPIRIRKTKVTGKTTRQIGRIARGKNKAGIKKIRRKIKRIIRRR